MKKLMSMFVALSVFAFGFNVNAVETDIDSSDTPAGTKSPCATIEVSESESDYLIYNVETGKTSYYSFANLFEAEANTITSVDGESTPSKVVGEEIPPSEPVSPSAIVGSDNRTKVNSTTVGPYSSTVYIVATFPNGQTKRGSGFMIGPSAVATAGHCVYVKDYGGIASSVEVFPAKNGSTNPYGKATSSNVLVSSAYVSNGLVNNDWAVVELNSKIGNQTGWLGLKWQTASYNGQFVYNTGYPYGDYAPSGQNSANPYMYQGTGYIKESVSAYFKGDWDSSGGNSGGPVFAYYSDTGYTAIGILTNGSVTSTNGSNYPTAFTTATRITETVFNLFKSYQ